MRSLLGALLLLLLATVTAAISTSGNRLLVLGEAGDKDGYAMFLSSLKMRGFDIQFDSPDSEDLKLFRLGDRVCDHVILLPMKSKDLGPNLTPKILLDFVKDKGNILVALSSKVPAAASIVSFLAELDISLPAGRTGTVVDHFHYDTTSAANSHDVLVIDGPEPLRPGMREHFELPPDAVVAMPYAVGHILGPSQLLTPILRAPLTAYNYDPQDESESIDVDGLFAAGRQLGLLTLMQARNSARVSILGSADMLRNDWLQAKVSRVGETAKLCRNRELARLLTGWTFQELAVLRVNSIEHRLKNGGKANPSTYRIKNEVTYSISISEYAWDRWVPLVMLEDDEIQLEVSMLSPFHRLSMGLQMQPSSTTFFRSFLLPDQHGIFNFRVNYKRPLMTYIDEKTTVSVRHMAHNEWPRSFVISGAWPWISGVVATATGFLGFCALWMYSKPAEKAVTAARAGKK